MEALLDALRGFINILAAVGSFGISSMALSVYGRGAWP